MASSEIVRLLLIWRKRSSRCDIFSGFANGSWNVKSMATLLTCMFFLLPPDARSQDSLQSVPVQSGFSGLHGGLLYCRFSDFPVSTVSPPFGGGAATMTSDASAYGFTLGYVVPMLQARGFAGLELEFSRARFNRIDGQQKQYYSFNLFVDVGIFFTPDPPVGIFASFGGGVLYHAVDDLSSWWMSSPSSASDYLDKYEYPFIFGFGLKGSPVTSLVLKCEYRFMYRTTTGTGAPVPGKEGWYYAESRWYSLGQRFAIGISYNFGSLD